MLCMLIIKDLELSTVKKNYNEVFIYSASQKRPCIQHRQKCKSGQHLISGIEKKM